MFKCIKAYKQKCVYCDQGGNIVQDEHVENN